MGRMPQVRPAIVRWGLVLGLVSVFSGAGLAAPPIPGHPGGAVDDLADQEWDWEEVRREGLVVDLLGRPRNGTIHPEIAYRVHGDIAAIEGTLLRDASQPAAQPVFNTGARLFEIVFDPPLELADGGRLERVRPAALNWTGGESSGSDGRLYLNYDAAVSRSPNGTTGAADDGGMQDVLFLGYAVNVNNVSSDNRASSEAPFVRSLAMAQFHYHVAVVREALTEEGARRFNDTSARFAFLFDFGGSANGRLVFVNATEGMAGLYLYRGDAAATFNFYNWLDSRPTLEAEALTGGPPPGENATDLLAPVALNVTLPGARPSTHSADYRLDVDFGYLLDLPEPATSPPPEDSDGEDSPVAHSLVVLVGALLLLAVLRRTEAHT